jgi:hypothetical protein
MALCVEFDGQRLGTGYAWSSATVSVTYGLDTEVWTPSADVADPYTAYSELAAWIADGARPWASVTASVTWQRGILDIGNGAGGVELGVAYSVLPDTFTPSAAFDALTTVNDNIYPVSVWPPNGWTVKQWHRQGFMGDASNTGPARPGATGLGAIAWTAEAIMTLDDCNALQSLLKAATSPRRGWILQESTGGIPTPYTMSRQVDYGTWRQVAIGPMTQTRAGVSLWRVTLELGADPL